MSYFYISKLKGENRELVKEIVDLKRSESKLDALVDAQVNELKKIKMEEKRKSQRNISNNSKKICKNTKKFSSKKK